MRFADFVRRVLGISFILVLCLSLSYNGMSANASEPSLTDIFNYLGFTNVAETSLETFPSGTYNITLYAEFAGYCDENELSYYQVNTSLFNTIFTGPEGGSGYINPPVNETFTANYQFGLSMLSPDGSGGTHRYFTETWRNPDGEQHAKVYQNLNDPDMFLIGFENLYGAGDRDYNDMVFSMKCITYDLTITASAGGSTDPVPGTYSHGCGSSVSVTAVPDSCYVFDHWELDGVPVGSANPYIVTMDDDHTLHAVFSQISYDLVISAGVGGTTSPVPGTYSHGCGSSVSVTAVPDSCYVFDHWELDGVPVGSANPYIVTMDDDHTLHAVFTYSPPPLSVSISPLSASIIVGNSVPFTSNVSGGASPYTYQWYINDNPVSGAASSSWTFTPTSPGLYHIYLKVTDACNNTAQSETARISAGPETPPVGGYSVSFTKPVVETASIWYTVVLGMFSVVMILVKRKRK